MIGTLNPIQTFLVKAPFFHSRTGLGLYGVWYTYNGTVQRGTCMARVARSRLALASGSAGASGVMIVLIVHHGRRAVVDPASLCFDRGGCGLRSMPEENKLC